MRHITLLAAALLFASPALAQRSDTWAFEVRPLVGAFVPLGEHRDDFRNATMLGAQAALEITDYFHVVGGMSWAHGHARYAGLARDLTYIWQYDMGVELGPMFETSLLLWRPFIGVGAGGRTYDYRDPGTTASTCTAGYGGLGTEFQGDLLGLRLEGRGYATCYESLLTTRKDTRFDAALMVGFTYRFR